MGYTNVCVLSNELPVDATGVECKLFHYRNWADWAYTHEKRIINWPMFIGPPYFTPTQAGIPSKILEYLANTEDVVEICDWTDG